MFCIRCRVDDCNINIFGLSVDVLPNIDNASCLTCLRLLPYNWEQIEGLL